MGKKFSWQRSNPGGERHQLETYLKDSSLEYVAVKKLPTSSKFNFLILKNMNKTFFKPFPKVISLTFTEL